MVSYGPLHPRIAPGIRVDLGQESHSPATSTRYFANAEYPILSAIACLQSTAICKLWGRPKVAGPLWGLLSHVPMHPASVCGVATCKRCVTAPITKTGSWWCCAAWQLVTTARRVPPGCQAKRFPWGPASTFSLLHSLSSLRMKDKHSSASPRKGGRPSSERMTAFSLTLNRSLSSLPLASFSHPSEAQILRHFSLALTPSLTLSLIRGFSSVRYLRWSLESSLPGAWSEWRNHAHTTSPSLKLRVSDP